MGRKGCVVRTKVIGITTDLSEAGSHLVDRRGIRNSDPLESPLEAKEATALSETMNRLVSIYGNSFWGDGVFRNKVHKMGRKVKRTCARRQQYIPPVKHRGSVGMTMQNYVSNKLDRQKDRQRNNFFSIESIHTVGAIFDICRERPRAITAHSLQPELALFSLLLDTPEFRLFV